MADLSEMLNKGHNPVEVVKVVKVDPFDVKSGPIPYVVPVLRNDGRTFAGGNVIFKERLDSLVSEDTQRINAWGENYFDLADMCLTFEDLVKLKADSPLLKGIRGVVETSDGLFVAFDAKAVAKATKGKMKYFKVSGSETVTYGTGSQKIVQTERDLVLLRYIQPRYIETSADQFQTIEGKLIKRKDLVLGRDRKKEEIIRNGKVIAPEMQIYQAKTIVPLVETTFAYNKKVYDYYENMGFYLASEPQNHAEMRALCVDGLYYWSWLGGNLIGFDDARVVGVVEKSAAGAAKK